MPKHHELNIKSYENYDCDVRMPNYFEGGVSIVNFRINYFQFITCFVLFLSFHIILTLEDEHLSKVQVIS